MNVNLEQWFLNGGAWVYGSNIGLESRITGNWLLFCFLCLSWRLGEAGAAMADAKVAATKKFNSHCSVAVAPSVCLLAISWLNIRDFSSSINVKQGDPVDFFEIHFDLDLVLKCKIWLYHDPETGCRCVAPAPAAEVAGVTFSDSDSAPVPKFLNPFRVRKFFKFENPTLVQIPATIDANEILVCFYLRNDKADSSTVGIETWLRNRVNKLMWGGIIQKAKIICCNWEFYFNIGFRNKNKHFRFNQKLN